MRKIISKLKSSAPPGARGERQIICARRGVRQGCNVLPIEAGVVPHVSLVSKQRRVPSTVISRIRPAVQKALRVLYSAVGAA